MHTEILSAWFCLWKDLWEGEVGGTQQTPPTGERDLYLSL